MAKYADRLRERTKLLAILIEQLANDRTISYQKLAGQTGVPRNVLYYFVGSTKKANADDYSTVKVDVLAKILSWFEETNFEDRQFNDKQRETARKISATFQHEDSDGVYGNFANGFVLSSDELKNLEQKIAGIYLAIRLRGKSKQIQVSGMEFFREKNSPYFRWTMYFPQGSETVKLGQIVPREAQKIHVVNGYVTDRKSVITCLGRKKDSHDIHFMNLMCEPKTGASGFFRALYTSYSRKEAIARAMVLIPQNDIDSRGSIDLFNQLGDFPESDFQKFAPNCDLDQNDLKKGVSVAWDQFKSLPEKD